MKFYKIFCVLFTVLLLTGWSWGTKEVLSNEIVKRNDLVYLINSKTPFTGIVKKLRDDDSVFFVEVYKDGELTKRERFASNGQLIEHIVKVDGKLQLKEYFSNNGQLELRSNYQNGKLHGLYESYHYNGKRKQHTNYSNGYVIDPIYETFYASGNTNIKITYDQNLYEIFENNKKKQHKERFTFKSNSPSIKNGLYERFNEGVLIEKSYYKDDKLDGEYKLYKKTNNQNSSSQLTGVKASFLTETGEYQNDAKVGKWQKFYSTGELEEESFFLAGKLDGILTKYHVDGSYTKTNYENGFKHGQHEYYDQEGIRAKGEYLNGNKEGIWRFFGSSGLTDLAFYKNNRKEKYDVNLIKKENRYYLSNSKLPFTGVVIGYNEGRRKCPSIRSKAIYVDGQKNGNEEHFKCDGTVEKESNFSNGLKNGLEIDSCGTRNYLNGKLSLKSHETYVKNGITYEGNKIKPFTGELTYYSYEPSSKNSLFCEFTKYMAIRNKVTYLDGLINGEILYSINGNSHTGKYILGKKDGFWVEKIDDDFWREISSSTAWNLEFSGEYSSGKKNGKWQIQDRYKKLRGEIKFENDNLTGYAKFYADDYRNYRQDKPIVDREGWFRDGLKNGAWVISDPKSRDADEEFGFSLRGNLWRGEFIDDKKEGVWILVNEDLNQRAIGSYKNGLKQGMWKFFCGLTTICRQGSYLNDMKTGHWTEPFVSYSKALFGFNFSGSVWKGDYLDDKKDGVWTVLDRKNYEIANGPFVAGKKTGKWTFFCRSKSQLGEVCRQGYYKNDKRSGVWKEQINGKLEDVIYPDW